MDKNQDKKRDRKARNREIERAKRQKGRIAKGIMFCLVLIIAGAAGFAVWSWIDGRTIMHVTYQGVRTRVAESDFHFVTLLNELEGEWPTPETHQVAIDALVQTEVLLQRGAMHGLVVDDEVMETLEGEASMLRDQLQWHPTRLNFITDRRIAEIWSAAPMFELLMDVYVADFALSPEEQAELDEEWLEHYDMVRDWLISREVKYAATEDWEAMYAAVSAYQDGEMDFDELIREVCDVYDGEIRTVDFEDFIDEYQIWMGEDWMDLFEYGEGETSHVFAADGEMLFIMHVVSSEFDYEALEEEEELFRENFVRFARMELFNEMVEDWTADASVERNERAVRRALRRSENNAFMFGGPALDDGMLDFGDFDFGDFDFGDVDFDMDLGDVFDLDFGDLIFE
ncbi:MAG: hypothetical protein FWF77_07725 [Defluviitaleaceae bacterium]|nr:hypothetical protein [Defluviitaleaceae bacterium]